ncbi:unnamed protein product (macronuclear) [Paramecium tetraurelia]|uniref:Uncharacterized protein n=1 Tax=Paramecium tetraurelia TaxID=5888 RepID=A0CLH7_PARTE|nr:uncharacterized protein GSPATT00008192001 [Paramecium tetraurelia]CAK71644.1 unnamed protein product [Paramecium tetraurelia]|eukprot:XP_001439041.1 hypothetical protein (macronuclear) [Paramecium tetraurelia strain d4-2]
MGNACYNQPQNATQMHTQEEESLVKEGNLIVIQNMCPIIKKHEYQLENLNEGIGVGTITAIIIKPKDQSQVVEILRGIKNTNTEIRYNNRQDYNFGTPSSKNDSKRSTMGKCNSERHVHFQVPQMQIVKHEHKQLKYSVKK